MGSSVGVGVAVFVGVTVGEAVGVIVSVAVGVGDGGKGVSVGGTGVNVGGSGLLVASTSDPVEHAAKTINKIINELYFSASISVLNYSSPSSFLGFIQLHPVFREPCLAG